MRRHRVTKRSDFISDEIFMWKKVAAAVVIRAYQDCLCKNVTSKRVSEEKRQELTRWQKDALTWIFSDNDGPATFYHYCQFMDVSMWKIRNKIVQELGLERWQLLRSRWKICQ